MIGNNNNNNTTTNSSISSSNNNRYKHPIRKIIIMIIYGLLCFYLGILVGTSVSMNNHSIIQDSSMKEQQQKQRNLQENMKNKTKNNNNSDKNNNSDNNNNDNDTDDCWTIHDERLHKFIQDRVKRELKTITKRQDEKLKLDKQHEQLKQMEYEKQKQQQQQKQMPQQEELTSSNNIKDETRFPLDSVGKFVVGMGRINRNEFVNQFDIGVPIDVSSKGNRDVLLLYNKNNAIPTSNTYLNEQIKSLHTEIPYIDNVNVATENCNQLHLILTEIDSSRNHQCIAIMGQYESYHIHKFMRLPYDDEINNIYNLPLNTSLPLRYVNRGAQINGLKSLSIPSSKQTLNYWETILTIYLQNLSIILNELKPIAKHVASNNPYNAIIVLVCNYGQVELLLNFVCNAYGKGLQDSLKSILVFATDEETYNIISSIGELTVFYDKVNTQHIPKKHANAYADNTFGSIMMSKVYCVQMTLLLGYDVLFQDVDVIWYRHPLEFFHKKTTTTTNNNNKTTTTTTTTTNANNDNNNNNNNKLYDYDIYFQDDGNHGIYYAPYSANSGFYYVRNNKRTIHFINSLLMSGDLIQSTHSHQIPLITLLSEYASRIGLLIKVFHSTTTTVFPGGYNYHMVPSYMKDLIQNRLQPKPYIFHMSWTANKMNKIKFYQQLGEWYLQSTCYTIETKTKNNKDEIIKYSIHKDLLINHNITTITYTSNTTRTISSSSSSNNNNNNNPTLIPSCCSKEPLITCHYRDKPSKFPCKNSPPLDPGYPDFW